MAGGCVGGVDDGWYEEEEREWEKELKEGERRSGEEVTPKKLLLREGAGRTDGRETHARVRG